MPRHATVPFAAWHTTVCGVGAQFIATPTGGIGAQDLRIKRPPRVMSTGRRAANPTGDATEPSATSSLDGRDKSRGYIGRRPATRRWTGAMNRAATSGDDLPPEQLPASSLAGRDKSRGYIGR
jgi:hypothetical protein